MALRGLARGVGRDLLEGDLYQTPSAARSEIEREVSDLHLPFLSFGKRNRAREEAKKALKSITTGLEPTQSRYFTGTTGAATVYVKRRVNNEDQAAADQIRRLLKPATDEKTYRALGPGGWHMTMGKAVLDLEGASRDEFIEEIESRFEQKLSGLLVPVGGVAIMGARICGNEKGSHGSSRFIGLVPAPKAGMLEGMRDVKTLLNPNAETDGDDWFRVPHVSVATAGPRLFELSRIEQQRLEGNIVDAVSQAAENIRPLTLTSLCIEISDYVC